MPDYEKEDEKVFPWDDEEGRKRKPKRGDGIPPKTNIQSRVHSKPKTDGQDYLDMYIGTKEKERTETYGELLKKRLKSISTAWRDLKKDLVRKEKEMPPIPKGGIEESEEQADTEAKRGKKTPGHMKKMDWKY